MSNDPHPPVAAPPVAAPPATAPSATAPSATAPPATAPPATAPPATAPPATAPPATAHSSATSQPRAHQKHPGDILWDYRNQLENIFYQRTNFFLVAESMLLVAFTTVITKDGLRFTPYALGVVGTLLSFIWLFVSWRQRVAYIDARKAVEVYCPEYKDLRAQRSKVFLTSSWNWMTYLVPALLIFTWVVLLASLLCGIP